MKPKTWEEFEDLYNRGDIEVLIQEEQEDGTTRLLILDHRRVYEDGEIYEVIV